MSKKLTTVAGSTVLVGALAATVVVMATDPGEKKSAGTVGSAAATAWPLVQGSTYQGLSSLSSIAAAPDGTVWAGGSQTTSHKTLLKKLSGGKWSDVALPASLGYANVNSLSAPAANNLWWAGQLNVSGDRQPLGHWNGSKWGKYTVPLSFFPDSMVAADAKTAFTAGFSPVGKRWNGTSWSDTNIGINTRVFDASSATNVWAAGFSADEAQPAVARWNGKAWTRVPFPKIDGIVRGEIAPAFSDLKVISANDVWAVGSVRVKNTAGKQVSRSLFAHWNGTKWTHTVGADGTYLMQVESDGAGGIWVQSDSATMKHRTAAGVWSTETLAAPAGKSARATEMVLQPGTKTIWVAGTTENADRTFDMAIWRSNS
ncbi:hypothetical protein [Spirillospora sp. NBC_01491]|uniref:hypothetical protein n=1 Tax=Spirillospora sp. NBC_01491 TaxID=2976007 RepID=UPI002E315EC4|nr:hypothetical protein [Spirillospora sp. NBC_01491]